MSERKDLANRNRTGGFTTKFATLVVDKRHLFFFIFSAMIIFSVFSLGWVHVENELSAYLGDESETKKGLSIMEEEFTTYGMANVMITSISYEQAEAIAKDMGHIQGVGMVMFDDTPSHYNDASALFNVTFSYDENDERCVESLELLMEKFKDYDMYVDTDIGDIFVTTINKEITTISLYIGVIVLLVLIFTSQSYAEVPVMLITFLAAALINMGTNFFFGTISFISDSVAIVLQLALSVDYAIILVHRFKEEKVNLPAREAVITALSKAIPEISSSSLTTICGLLAMTFMEFKVGWDMGFVLMKSIFLSLLSVFTLMPGVLVAFSKLMDRSEHRNFMPKVTFIGKFAYSTRKIIPPIFITIFIASIYLSGQAKYVFGYDLLKTTKKSEMQIIRAMINETFDTGNMLVLMVPEGQYETEARLISHLEEYDEVAYAMGLSNVEAMEGYMLVDRLTPRQFSELTDMDYEVARLLYAAYAVKDEKYGEVISGLEMYSVPLIDMFLYLYDQVNEGYVKLDKELQDSLDEAYELMGGAKEQLHGKNHSRIMLNLNLPVEGDETFQFLDTIHGVADVYYDDDVYLVGESTSHYDLSKAFSGDNTLVSVLSVVFVIIILLFTFKSVALPIFLITVIQGSIWINFSFSYVTNSNVLFMVYMICSAIQMGANIDYAIVISNRFLDLKMTMPKREAIIETMNQAFPTLITSGSMMGLAGVLIGTMTSDPAISGMGVALGRGTFISLILVIFVLPQILLLGESLIDKTTFTLSRLASTKRARGVFYVNGIINGKIEGMVNANVKGIIRGDMDALVQSGEITVLSEEADEGEDGQ